MALQVDSLQSDALVLKLLGKLHPEAYAPILYRVAAKCAASARQAMAFELTADHAEWSTRPMLEYYAMLQWIKALLHLFVLDYPPSSAVLQHGMSTRRMKRDNYRWPLESVYLYKQGVLQSFHTFTSQGAGGDGEAGTTERTGGEFRPRGSAEAGGVAGTGGDLPSQLVIGNLLVQVPDMDEALAWFYPHFRVEEIYPPWLTQFVLLFSLSALCRYNPVEWTDIVIWTNEIDAHLVRQFLSQPRYRFRLEDFALEFL